MPPGIDAMREIVFDTETTGLDPLQGHRLVEVGCVELINRIPSGNTFHRYINPERSIPPDATAIHGIDDARVKSEKIFAAIVDEMLDFIGDAPLVAHNAMFDLGFLNAELERAKKKPLPRERMVDTLVLARRKHPAGPNRLDDLCSRYGIDNSRRSKHGALLDAEILAEVYLELIGGRQANLVLVETVEGKGGAQRAGAVSTRPRPEPLPARLTDAEREAHRKFVDTLGKDPLWRNYLPGA